VELIVSLQIVDLVKSKRLVLVSNQKLFIMKKVLFLISLIMSVALIFNACEKVTLKETAPQQESQNLKAPGGGCTTIQSGLLVNSQGDPIQTGYDAWGYNYQARIFNGKYCDAYYGATWCLPWADVNLIMKWNDAWLSNKDCDGDGLLDRHLGFDSYIGSGAWLTNHMSGTYTDDDGNLCEWDYFVKIIAVPSDAYADSGIWYNADGTEIGPVIWGAFATIQQVYNDPCAGYEGLQYLSPDHAGLGGW